MRHQIANLVTNGFYREALSLYSHHNSASHPLHNFIFPPLLKACAKLGCIINGRILHSQILKTGFFADVYAATALASLYMKLNSGEDALKLFDEMPERNVATLNVGISGLSQNGCFKEAFRLFREARICGSDLNSVSIASVLSGCENLEIGVQMHGLAVKLGFELESYVGTSLISLYSNCEETVLATRMFELMPNKSVVTYNAFLSGMLQNGIPRVTLEVFKLLKETTSEKPNSVTLVNVVSACTSLLYLQFGRQIHCLAKKTEYQFHTMVGTALVDMYSKCGRWRCAYDVFNELNGAKNLITWNSMISGMMMNRQFETAVELFDSLVDAGLEPDSATWNSMINGFSQLGMSRESFKFFEKMQSAGVVPNLKCLTSLLSACSDCSALKSGKEIQGYATRADIVSDIFIATSLIDMYMKCGFTSLASRIFHQFVIKPNDPAFWNAMISGYGRNGEYESVFETFDLMREMNVEPNSATFNSVLSACSHSGQTEKACQFFNMMHKKYKLRPNPEHFGSMVDLLGRHGKLHEAKSLIEEMPDPSPSVFSSLLGACKHHLDPELGKEMAMKLSELEPANSSSVVILSGIYAALGQWEDVERTRGLIEEKRLIKPPGYSSAVVT